MSAVATVPPAKTLITAEEFLTFCERPENDDRKFELVRGEVIELSLPTKMHGIVVSNIDRRLGNYAEQIGPGYSVTGDSGVVLDREPDTVRGPDVAYFIDVETIEEVEDGWAESPPVLAVEVRSPNDKEKEVNQKVQEYLTAGVRVVWVVNYEERFLTVYRPNQNLLVLEEEAEISLNELPGFSGRVADFFRLPGRSKSLTPSTP